MILADAIEAWGEAHKAHLNETNLQKLGSVWKVVRKADVGSREVSAMTKDDARDAMLLFEEDQRGDIAELLNTIRSWTLEHDSVAPDSAIDDDGGPDTEEADQPDSEPSGRPLVIGGSSDGGLNLGSGPSDYGSLPDEPEIAPLPDPRAIPEPTLANTAQVSADPSTPPTPIVTREPDEMTAPVTQLRPSIDPMAQNIGAPPAAGSRLSSPAVVPQGPAPALPPPLGYEDDTAPPIPWQWIAAAVVGLIVILGLYFALRGGDDDPASTVTTTEDATAAVTTDDGLVTGETSPGGEFCALARQYASNDPFANISTANGATFFQVVLDVWSGMGQLAPPDVAGDIATLQSEVSALNEIASGVGYNTSDPGYLTAIQQRGFTALGTASVNIDNYVTSTCAVDMNTGVDGIV